jgi:signal transduction histidine kinase
MLYREGLASALDWLASRASERLDVAFSFRTTEPPPTVPQDLAIVLFQCARELVYNVAKHASAKIARIALEMEGGSAVLTVTDDGNGFDPSPSSRRQGGFGLFSIRERVVLFGGELSVASTDAGSRICVRLPINPANESGPRVQQWLPGQFDTGPREPTP